MKPVVFLGGGRITSALIAGLRAAEKDRRVIVYDRNPAKSLALKREWNLEVATDLELALAQAAMAIVAVRPASVSEILRQAAECQERPRLWISLAAGIPLRVLRSRLGAPVTWVRAMPSPVSRIGRGLTGLCFDRSMGKRNRARVRSLFARVGDMVEVTEPQFDAFTATYSCSHGYHALAVLAKAARDAGLNAKTARIAAAHALADAILYWRESGLSLESLLHEAATPGGIAAAAMRAMDGAGYARAVSRGMEAGVSQARRNAKK
jgi:pyrroline-5-carboxylate reductase